MLCLFVAQLLIKRQCLVAVELLRPLSLSFLLAFDTFPSVLATLTTIEAFIRELLQDFCDMRALVGAK